MILFARSAAFVCLFFLSSLSVFGQEGTEPQVKELGFIEKLRAEEEQEHLALESQIMSMSDSDYKAMLAQRMERAFAVSGSNQRLAIIVDVSEQMNQSKGLLNKVLGRGGAPKLMGIEVVKTALNTQSKAKMPELTLKMQTSSDDGLKHYQKIEGIFPKQACETLLSNQKVTDIVLVSEGNTQTIMETFFVPKGRVLPAPAYKKYDDSFIYEGYFKELMARLATTETVFVAIGFRVDSEYQESPSFEKEKVLLAKVDEFLRDMAQYDIEVLDKSVYGIYAVVSREAANAIYVDHRTTYIRLGKEGEAVY